MSLDFNSLNQKAFNLVFERKFEDALRIYLYLAEDDPSMEAGYIAERIGDCYEGLNRLDEARYWYGVAVSKNPSISVYKDSYERLSHVKLECLKLIQS